MAEDVVTSAPTLAQRTAAFVEDLRFEDLPAEVVTKAKRLIAYDIGQALAGVRFDDGRRAIAIAEALSEGAGPATVLGTGSMLRTLDAAFANSSLMRSPGMDDVILPHGIHAGLVTLPPAIAIAEERSSSGRELIVALVAAYEAMAKLAGEAMARAERRTAPTSQFGPIGAAVVTGKLLGLGHRALTNAICYGATAATGVLTDHDPLPHGYALMARNGMMAAFLADSGAGGSPRVLEDEHGLYATFFGGVPSGIDDAIAQLGIEFEILYTSTKRYPGTGLHLNTVELARELMTAQGLGGRDVVRLEATMPARREIVAPRETYSYGPFTSAAEAASSLPFQLAMLLLDDGRTDHSRYTRYDARETAEALARVHLVFDPDHAGPLTSATLRIMTRAGQMYEKHRAVLRLPDPDVRSALAAGELVLPGTSLDRAAELIERLEAVADVSELTGHLRPSQRER
jgi:2-methylcitrate dehydratase PrpD